MFGAVAFYVVGAVAHAGCREPILENKIALRKFVGRAYFFDREREG
jgi:hypothetical protein